MSKKILLLFIILFSSIFIIGMINSENNNPNYEQKIKEIIIEKDNFLPVNYENLRYSYLRGSKSIVLPEFSNDFRCMPIYGTGDSMKPLLSDGNTLIRIPYKEDYKIKKGQIIDFDVETMDYKGSVVHQVVEVQDKGVITKGINNNEKDTFIPFENIKCLVVGVLFTNIK